MIFSGLVVFVGWNGMVVVMIVVMVVDIKVCLDFEKDIVVIILIF